jgi:hypothetical protein
MVYFLPFIIPQHIRLSETMIHPRNDRWSSSRASVPLWYRHFLTPEAEERTKYSLSKRSKYNLTSMAFAFTSYLLNNPFFSAQLLLPP